MGVHAALPAYRLLAVHAHQVLLPRKATNIFFFDSFNSEFLLIIRNGSSGTIIVQFGNVGVQPALSAH